MEAVFGCIGSSVSGLVAKWDLFSGWFMSGVSGVVSKCHTHLVTPGRLFWIQSRNVGCVRVRRVDILGLVPTQEIFSDLSGPVAKWETFLGTSGRLFRV